MLKEKYHKLFNELRNIHEKSLDDNIIKRKLNLCGKAGIFKHAVKETHGGYGDGFTELCQVHELLGQEIVDGSLLLSINAHIWGSIFPLICFGTEMQKKKFLPELLNGTKIGGHAITEPNAGSDIQAMLSQAILHNDNYILNGHKRYITNTPIAELLIVYVKVNSYISAFIVEKSDMGSCFLNGPTVSGFKNAPMGDLILTDCILSKDRLLGKVDAGTTMVQYALELERAFLFAGISGIMSYQLKNIIQFVRTRLVNQKPLGNNQAISHKIAEMSVRLDTVKMWVQQCAQLKDQGKRISFNSSQSKLYCSEAFLQSSLDSIHIMGALGLETSKGYDQLIQDALACRLLSGSNEIQKNIISVFLGIGLY